MRPLSKLASEAVTVWAPPSLLVHMTVPPTAIVTACEVNVSLASDTVAVVGGAVSVGGGEPPPPAGGGVAEDVTTIVPAKPGVCRCPLRWSPYW